MAIILTNGVYFISHNATGGVIKVSTIEQAQNFYTMEKAENQINKVPGKEYWIVDSDKNRITVYDFKNESGNEYKFEDIVKTGLYEDLEIDFKELNLE